MDVYTRYFSRLVVGNAPQIFPGSLNRSVANPGNYQLLVNEVRKVAHDVEQAGKIAESIETATEDIFRDFDLSTFMEHFKLDALEKTILALACKATARPDLRTKGKRIAFHPCAEANSQIADAILHANYAQFLQLLAAARNQEHEDLDPTFVATIVDRFIQNPNPTFNQDAQSDLQAAIDIQYRLRVDKT
jgi:CCR4-NOT transcription complex subunit 1